MNMMHKQLFQIRMILPWMAVCVIGAMVTTQKVSATPMVNQAKTPSNRLLTPVQNVQIGITAMDSIRISWDVSNQSSANVVTIKKRVDDGPFYVVGTTNAEFWMMIFKMVACTITLFRMAIPRLRPLVNLIALDYSD